MGFPLVVGALCADGGSAHATSGIIGEGSGNEQMRDVNQEANYSRSFSCKNGKHYPRGTGTEIPRPGTGMR
jgi:hypothetical protein